jgi:hypothetical protein
MFVVELYFIFYRVPKLMTRLARERNRSALLWSLLGSGSWVAAEFLVLFTVGTVYGLGELVFAWPEQIPPGLKIVSYVLSLAAALLASTIVSRILTRQPKTGAYSLPPEPPVFLPESHLGT